MMGSVEWVPDGTGQTVAWVPFVQAYYRRGCFDSFPQRDVDNRWRTHLKDGSAEVFADHLDANIASGPFFSIELERAEPFEVSEVLSELLSRKSLFFVSRIDIA